MVGACSSSVFPAARLRARTGQERGRRRTAGQILRVRWFLRLGVGKESEALLQIVFVVVEEHVQTPKSADAKSFL
jgi:hypothetical protein